MAMTIPEHFQNAALILAQLSPNQQKQFIEWSKAVTPTLSPNRLVEELRNFPSELLRNQAGSVLGVLIGLANNVSSDRSVELVVNDFVDAVQKLDKQNESDDSKIIYGEFRKFVYEIISDSSLSISGRALWLSGQYEQLYNSADIYSELRAVFSQINPEEAPKAAIVMHALTIKTWSGHDDDHNEQTTVAILNRNDLLKLQKVIDRALAKHEGLKNLAKQSDLTLVEEVE